MTAIDTHVDDALARFQQTLKDQPNLASFLTAVVAPVQDIEDALQQLLTERTVDTAVGDQLTDIGAIVGEPRSGLSDADYRPRVRARIMANRSRGIVEDLIRIARLVIDDDALTVKVQTWGIAAYDMTLGGVTVTGTLADALLAFLQDASGAGVRPILNYSPSAPANNLIWNSSTAAQFWNSGTWASSKD